MSCVGHVTVSCMFADHKLCFNGRKNRWSVTDPITKELMSE